MEADKTNSKIMNASFLAAGVLAYILAQVLFTTLGGIFSMVERWRSIIALQHGVPIVLGVGTFLALVLNAKTKSWADEVVTEIRKIVWPSQRDTTVTTVAVCVMVIVAGLGFAFVDYLSSILIKWIVN